MFLVPPKLIFWGLLCPDLSDSQYNTFFYCPRVFNTTTLTYKAYHF